MLRGVCSVFTDFQRRLTYFGTLDDVVERYPWPMLVDKASIHRQLVTAVMYDKKILINDGYLIAHPYLVDELSDIDRSLLGNMLMTGAARVFARGGPANLAAGIEQNAPAINTHRHIVQKAHWRLIRDDLEFLSGELEHYCLSWPSNKNLGEAFVRLLERVRELPAAQRGRMLPGAASKSFDQVFDIFDRELERPSYRGARGLFESVAWQCLHGSTLSDVRAVSDTPLEQRDARFSGYADIRTLMAAANDMYHLAYAVGAHEALQSSAFGREIDRSAIGVATSLVTELQDLVGAEGESSEAPTMDQAKLDALNELLISLPANIRFANDFAFVTRMKTKGSCRRARAAYLETVKAFIDDRVELKIALQARDEYVNELAALLEPGMKRSLDEYALGRALDYAFKPFEIALDAIGAVGAVAQFALPIGVDRLKNAFVERLVRARVRVALHAEGTTALQDARATPMVRQLGFYLGPVKTEGAKTLLKEVSAPA